MLSVERENDDAAVAILSGFASEIPHIARIAILRQSCEDPVIRSFHGYSADRVSAASHRAQAIPSLVHLLFCRGLLNPISEAVFTRARASHQRLDVSGDEFKHGLVVLVTAIVSWLGNFGWRRLSETEEKILSLYFKRVGRRIGVTELPDDFAGYTRLYADYRNRHPLAISKKGQELFQLGLRLEDKKRPRLINHLARKLYISCLDPDCCRALDVRRPNRLVRALSRVWWRLRCKLVNRCPIVRFVMNVSHMLPSPPRPAVQSS